MRGSDKRSGELFSYIDLDQRVRPDHPLRAIRSLTEAALVSLSSDFAGLYSGIGRPSIAPEMLLRAMLLQAFYSIRSERQLMERLELGLSGISCVAGRLNMFRPRPSRSARRTRRQTGPWPCTTHEAA